MPEAGTIPPGTVDGRVAALAARLAATGPVYASLTTVFPALRSRFVAHGIVQRVAQPGAPAVLPRAPDVDRRLHRFALRGVFDDAVPRDALALTALDAYLAWAALPADGDRRAGRLPATIAGYRAALRFPGWFVRAATLRDLGLAQALTGDTAGAEASFRAAARITPGDVDLWTNIAIACARQGRKDEARALVREVLRRNPAHARAASLLAELGGT